ncbi:MAG: hypothetical protein WHT46_03800 [Candidatus Geothermincolales bacterium]
MSTNRIHPEEGPVPTLRILHLYPDLMNIYGDRGNIISLVRRCRWRGIPVKVDGLRPGEDVDFSSYDLFFVGGGQDREQILVCEDLRSRGDELRRAVEGGAALLSICGGYQLLGREFITWKGDVLPGVGLFDVRTEGGEDRYIGNVVIESLLEGVKGSLVGFENHSGRTWLGPEATPLGRVVRGHGNNGQDGTEGCVYKGAVGTYLHGSLLPKNPHLADWLILKALRRRFQVEGLKTLDDDLEWDAHRAAVEKTLGEGKLRSRMASLLRG